MGLAIYTDCVLSVRRKGTGLKTGHYEDQGPPLSAAAAEKKDGEDLEVPAGKKEGR